MKMIRAGLSILLLLFVFGCDLAGDGDNVPDFTINAEVIKVGPLVTVTVSVFLGEEGIDDAEVTINGNTIQSIGDGEYSSSNEIGIESGSMVDLVVSRGEAYASGSLAMPYEPTVTSPALNDTVIAANPLTVTWEYSYSENPSLFNIVVRPSDTASGEKYFKSENGEVRTSQIPENTFLAENGQFVEVVASNLTLAIDGDSGIGSTLTVANTGVSEPFSVE